MLKIFYLLWAVGFLQCSTIKEIIECERNRDKDYPSAVSNCNQTQKEFNNKIDPLKEVRK